VEPDHDRVPLRRHEVREGRPGVADAGEEPAHDRRARVEEARVHRDVLSTGDLTQKQRRVHRREERLQQPVVVRRMIGGVLKRRNLFAEPQLRQGRVLPLETQAAVVEFELVHILFVLKLLPLELRAERGDLRGEITSSEKRRA
jgi:hypothetical protein